MPEAIKAAVSTVILANFLSVLQLVIPSILSVTTWTCNSKNQTQQQEDFALCTFMSSQNCLFMEFPVLIGQSGQAYKKMSFHFHCISMGGETWTTDQTQWNSEYCWNIELFHTYFKINKISDSRFNWFKKWLEIYSWLSNRSIWSSRNCVYAVNICRFYCFIG